MSLTAALQIFNITRSVVLIFTAILLAKSGIPGSDIGSFESFIFLSTVLSHFWVTSIIQSLLSLYKNTGTSTFKKSPEIFTAFILLLTYSTVLGCCILAAGKPVMNFFSVDTAPRSALLFTAYLILNNPSFLIEYIFLLRKNPYRMVIYGVISYSVQLALVTAPLYLGFSVEASFTGLVIVSVLRFVWLAGMLIRFSAIGISGQYLKMHLVTAFPLVLYFIIAGSEEYIGGFILKNNFDSETFAVYRFGARELPLSLLLANGLSNALIPSFAQNSDIAGPLMDLKKQTAKLCHIIFPVSAVLMIFSGQFYPVIFSDQFSGSAAIFNIFLLLAVPRMVFPQTILLGLRKNGVLLAAVIIETFVNLATSLILLNYMGITAVAWGVLAGFTAEKAFLILWCSRRLSIKPSDYIPSVQLSVYCLVLLITYCLG
ncbi:MAG: hypothetical protein HYY40_10345 [Bacteroidetes bacterium]|nr:hypothetical protein [Bacteroidota bacterium]